MRPNEDDPKTKRVSRSQVGTRASWEPRPNDPDTRPEVEYDPLLQVYCDYEAMTDAEGNQTPILLCAETDEEDYTEIFYGPDCTAEFFD